MEETKKNRFIAGLLKLKQALNSLRNRVKLRRILKLSAVGAVLLLCVYAVASWLLHLSPSSPAHFTVSVTNLEKTSGGTGVILETSPRESLVLTNRHVCMGVLLRQQGLVTTESNDSFLVTGFKMSNRHDVCLVKVTANLKYKANIAKKPLEQYEKVLISGHPALLPTTLTYGHFSDNTIICLISGYKRCIPKRERTEEGRLICEFFGGRKPIITYYSAQVLSATIMGGSSGSPVLNSRNEVVGLVFAGFRGLSYAFAVPLEDVVAALSELYMRTEFEDFDLPGSYEDSEEEFSSMLLEKDGTMMPPSVREDMNRRCTAAPPSADFLIKICRSLNVVR